MRRESLRCWLKWNCPWMTTLISAVGLWGRQVEYPDVVYEEIGGSGERSQLSGLDAVAKLFEQARALAWMSLQLHCEVWRVRDGHQPGGGPFCPLQTLAGVCEAGDV